MYRGLNHESRVWGGYIIVLPGAQLRKPGSVVG